MLPLGAGFISLCPCHNLSLQADHQRRFVRSRWNPQASMVKNQKRIAIVDDDPSMLRATMDLLDAQGFVARGFPSAEEFLIRGGAAQVDCLLLDIHLGGMSGIELRNQLKRSGSMLPVIFITALDDEDTRKQAHRAGCVEFLRKPYSARQLMDAIGKAVT